MFNVSFSNGTWVVSSPSLVQQNTMVIVSGQSLSQCFLVSAIETGRLAVPGKRTKLASLALTDLLALN